MGFPRNPNTFANNPLHRASEKRADDNWLKARLSDPSTRILLLRHIKPFVREREGNDDGLDIGWLAPEDMTDILATHPICVLLGEQDGKAHFAVEITDDMEPGISFSGTGMFAEYREVIAKLQPGDAAILAQAKSLIDWHRLHRFCANCGNETVLTNAGYKRTCGTCGVEHFPRIDPVVITLVVKGDRCLLGRGGRFPGNMYSALAGFIEPGETIEEAVVREIKEEVGVDVTNVRYHSTQPWPFPSSLMIGCIADAVDENVKVDGVEIESAIWLTRADARKLINGEDGNDMSLPPSMAIAHQLIRHWAFQDEAGI